MSPTLCGLTVIAQVKKTPGAKISFGLEPHRETNTDDRYDVAWYKDRQAPEQASVRCPPFRAQMRESQQVPAGQRARAFMVSRGGRVRYPDTKHSTHISSGLQCCERKLTQCARWKPPAERHEKARRQARVRVAQMSDRTWTRKRILCFGTPF